MEINPFSGDIINRAVNAGKEYVDNNKNIKSFILGVSGGVDSAVVAAIARRICDETNIRLIGTMIDIDGNKKEEIDRATDVGHEFCHDYEIRHMNDSFLSLMRQVDFDLYGSCTSSHKVPDHQEKIRAGNIKARIRMIHLYNLASKYNGLVLSTDNLTEYLLGFWTLHGDVGDLGLIQSLWKSEVYNIGSTIGGSCTACVEAVPTDGLGITNSDIDQILPNWSSASGSYIDAYRFIDDMLISCLKGNTLDHSVTRRYEDSKFKRINPINIAREVLLSIPSAKGTHE